MLAGETEVARVVVVVGVGGGVRVKGNEGGRWAWGEMMRGRDGRNMKYLGEEARIMS